MRQQYAIRSLILAAFLAIVGFGVLVQMVRIQNSEQAQLFLLQGDRYSGEFQMVYPERGEIYDRNGHLLAGNRTVFEVGVGLARMQKPHAPHSIFGSSFGRGSDELYGRWRRNGQFDAGAAQTIE